MVAYGQSKLANFLFTLELQQRLTAPARAQVGSPGRALAAHPGWASTNPQENDACLLRLLFLRLGNMVQQLHLDELPQSRVRCDGADIGEGAFVVPPCRL